MKNSEVSKAQILYFEPQVLWLTLARDIVVVAQTRVEGTWKAYVGYTDERSHKDAIPEVLAHGAAIREPIARAIFQKFKDLPYAR